MLTQETNQRLTQTGPDTPMGKMLRMGNRASPSCR